MVNFRGQPAWILHYSEDYPRFFALLSQCRVTFVTVGGAIVPFSGINLNLFKLCYTYSNSSDLFVRRSNKIKKNC